MRKERSSLAAEIITEIRRHVPDFSRPLAGQFGAGIQQGVETALEQFADLLEGTGESAAGEERLRVHRALGRGEFAEGRSLDALQAAYRVGARVAWRRYARVARGTGLGADRMVLLAEAIFAHIDELAAAAVAGYASARADEAGTFGRRRHRLLELMVSGAAPGAVRDAAGPADWPLPATVACVALGPAAPGDAPRALTLRMPDLVLADLDGAEPCLLVPEPALYLRDGQVQRVMQGRGAVIGPTVPPDAAAHSLRWARAIRACLPGPHEARAPVDCERCLPELLLLGDPALVELIAGRRLSPLAGLTPKRGERLAATLLAWLQTNRGSAPDVAARLGIHPQTARQRLHQVQRLFGPALADPDARFELEVALRSRLMASAFGAPPRLGV
ncbi:helix-turn-helix domain-containing protein [Actinacidiphila acidipaludis]|uniref:PucR family transcriptional regulator n=1 Tax=Actinacidiphila acidipaludis TaxID=2873382 RepID=UPI0027DF8DE5|nr:helix-turn-helix domain-containing protein [Streptomyces acidipaludis]